MLNTEIAHQIGLARKQVGLWRRRWQQSFDALVTAECSGIQAQLRRVIQEVFWDAPDAGGLAKFTKQLLLIGKRAGC